MTEIGLWVQSEDGQCYLIKKNPNGYPDLFSLSSEQLIENAKEKKELGKTLYKELTGTPYAHPDATSRQVLWDFLEAAIKHLP